MIENDNILEMLNFIDPSSLSYSEWTAVGMALKEEGYSATDWDNWSRKDSARYHEGECYKKWATFKGSGTPVTGGTIFQMAVNNGWQSVERNDGHELGWDSVIEKDNMVIVDTNWVEGMEIKEPKKWNPIKELIVYLETLFDSTELVGYVTRSWEKEGKYMPTKGSWSRTAGELIQDLEKCNGDIGAVLGDYNEEAGAWIRFNPLDGKGCRNENVTEFKYALVESDSTDLEKQNAIIRELELPIACLVYSGSKSIHAIVHIDAADYKEYRKRVDYLYSVCKKNGIDVDQQNKNPSRLSRMPGIKRGNRKQFLIDTNIGKSSWDEWFEWIEGINDDLPEPEPLEKVWENLPELSPTLIDGILRQGHKMLIAGPSKAGKSFVLIEMCIAIAEGKKWFTWQCAKGKILYVNLELDRASCLHRFKDVYNALGLTPNNLSNIDIWNLRGKSIPMDKLAPKLIRRAAKKNYMAIIIDPIYKVITGDENSADQMANFCNQFDKVCNELGCAVIYCHHHSKGSQSGKRSMDRASGSGVFARDPDALLDLIELNLTGDIIKQQMNAAMCQCCIDFLDDSKKEWQTKIGQDDMLSSYQMKEACSRILTKEEYDCLLEKLDGVEAKCRTLTGWRIEGTLREFPKFDPVNIWFDYPIHRYDDTEILQDIKLEDEVPFYKKGAEARKKQAKSNKVSIDASTENAFVVAEENGEATLKEMAEYLGISVEGIKKRLKRSGKFSYENGVVKRKK